MQKKRVERDSLGEMEVPADALYGAQTARAVANFPVSGLLFEQSFIRSLGLVKKYAAMVNRELGLLDPVRAGHIILAAEEVIAGTWNDHFVVDVFQTGSGTSTNMNMNEVLARRASQLMRESGDNSGIHPNDHVNLCQSSNDVIPTALHLALLQDLDEYLFPGLNSLKQSLEQKECEFSGVIKTGRTHLQDATPVRMGQVFSGYARQVSLGIERVRSGAEGILELPVGGTAVGTGINCHPHFPAKMIRLLREAVNPLLREADNHFEAQAARDGAVFLSGALKVVAVSLFKIANDIRFLGSGPRCGLGELRLPPVQPGSSIMPGKVNPVIAESLLQVCAQVVGNDAAVSLAGLSGNFELNSMMPVIIYNTQQSVKILGNGVRLFSERCIRDLEANKEFCEASVTKSLALCTPLSRIIGYDKTAELAHEAFVTGKSIGDVAAASGLLGKDELEKILDPSRMTSPGM